jgi:hypothetical protein
LSGYLLAGGVCAGAAPVVTPGFKLPRGVTSRIPGGAAGKVGAEFCAVAGEGVVAASCWCTDELFSP